MIFCTTTSDPYRLPSDRMATLKQDTNRLLLEAAQVYHRVDDESRSDMYEANVALQQALKALEKAYAKREEYELKCSAKHERLLAKLAKNS